MTTTRDENLHTPWRKKNRKDSAPRTRRTKAQIAFDKKNNPPRQKRKYNKRVRTADRQSKENLY